MLEKWGSVSGPLFCVRTDVGAKGTGTQKFGPKKFFPPIIPPPPHLSSQDDQRDVGIILSHRCCVDPPPPPARQVGRPRPGPPPQVPSRRPRREGGGGVGKMGKPKDATLVLLAIGYISSKQLLWGTHMHHVYPLYIWVHSFIHSFILWQLSISRCTLQVQPCNETTSDIYVGPNTSCKCCVSQKKVCMSRVHTGGDHLKEGHQHGSAGSVLIQEQRPFGRRSLVLPLTSVRTSPDGGLCRLCPCTST